MADESTRFRELGPWANKAVQWLALVFACYHLYVLGIAPIDPWIHRAIHLAMVSVILFCMVPARTAAPRQRPSLFDLMLILLMINTFIYIVMFFDELIDRLGVLPESLDAVFGTVACLLVLEMSRRLHGWVLPGIAVFFILYSIFGAALPGLIGHKGYDFQRTITFIYSLEGIYGPALAASATFVTLFVFFGAFLRHSGAGQFFVDLSYAAAGGRRGGPAKVAILASALFGSISGSAVSNAVTTGTFTIPLMKTVGYHPAFAAAVESVASTGGQLMPPVMSATAFVMAEITGIPYLQIVVAAILPSLLYFTAVYFMVDHEARNLNLHGVPRSELPLLTQVLRRDGHLLLPLLVMIYALVVMMVSPLKAALMGIITLILVSWLRPKSRMWPREIAQSLSSGMRNMMDIASACAVAGIIVGVFSLTGLGLKFATALLDFSGGHLWAALVLTMIVCIILGMGLPTVAAYIITAAAVAPALEQMGVPTLAAHLFVLYFAAISTITPPVAVTAFAAAGLAGAPPMKVGGTAVKLGIAAYIIPFMFVYSGALLLKGTLWEIVLTVPTALLGIWALAKGIQDRATAHFIRASLVVAALTLIKPGLYTDIVGIGIIVIVIVVPWLRIRQRLMG